MKYQLRIMAVIALGASVAFASAKSSTPSGNVLTLKNSIVDRDIKFPPSMVEEKTNELYENWYEENYLILDHNTNSPGVSASEEVIKQRLAAMHTSIEMPYNQVVRTYIDRYVVRGKSLVEKMIGLGAYYNPIFEEALERGGLPIELKYIPVIESALNPNAVSPAGAGGLWQFMVATAKGCGMEVSSTVDERRDPYRSSEMAVYYFKKLYDIYGDWSLAIAAYNCGPGNVNKALRRASSNISRPDFWDIYNYLPKETRGYVPAFIAANYAMTYYKEHGISPGLAKKPLLVDTVHVTHKLNFSQISNILGIPVEQIRILNPQYRTGVIPGSKSHPYSLTLPQQQIYAFAMLEDKIYNYDREAYGDRGTVEPGSNSRSDAADDGDNYADNTRTQSDNKRRRGIDDVRNDRNQVKVNGETDYVVKRGDTVEKIAKQFGMNPDDIYVLNEIKPDEELKAGRKIKVMRIGKDKVDNSGDPVPSIDDKETQSQQLEPRTQRPTRNSSGSSRYDYNSSRSNYNGGGGSRRGSSDWGGNNSESEYGNGGYRGNSGSGVTSVPPRRRNTPTQQQTVPPRKNTNSNNRTNTTTNAPQAGTGYQPAQQKTNTQDAAKSGNAPQAGGGYQSKSQRTRTYSNTAADANQNKGNNTQQKQTKTNAQQTAKPAKPAQHKVEVGDNLTNLANRYGVSQKEIIDANPGKIYNDVVQLGTTINIPNAKGKQQAQQQNNVKQQTQQQTYGKSKQQTYGKTQQTATKGKQQVQQTATKGKQQVQQTATKGKQQVQQTATKGKQQVQQPATKGKQQVQQTAAKGKQQVQQTTAKGKQQVQQTTAKGKQQVQQTAAKGKQQVQQAVKQTKSAATTKTQGKSKKK